jgi:tungstate transport system substrate-binding protein
MINRRALIAIAASVGFGTFAFGRDRSIIVASTTSTEDSGLFRYILPLFKAKTGIDVKVVAQGTGQALDTGRRGDADVVFVLVGPRNDPAGIKGSHDIVAALNALKDKRVPFISRGDRSGTHLAELSLWKLAGIDITAERGSWYKEIGQGMGAALNAGAASDAYVLSDRGTWLSFRNKRDLVVVVEGDERLFNQYGVMLVNPQKHPSVKKELGQQFIDWLISPEGQAAIAGYKINGEQLFYPNASDPSA